MCIDLYFLLVNIVSVQYFPLFFLWVCSIVNSESTISLGLTLTHELNILTHTQPALHDDPFDFTCLAQNLKNYNEFINSLFCVCRCIIRPAFSHSAEILILLIYREMN